MISWVLEQVQALDQVQSWAQPYKSAVGKPVAVAVPDCMKATRVMVEQVVEHLYLN